MNSVTGTRRRKLTGRFAAITAAASVTAVAAAMVVAGGQSAYAAVGCRVDYTVTNQWGGGFGANVTITNLGDALSSWSLEWTFTAGQRVDQLWGGEFSQSGSTVTVRNASYNGSLATGASTTPGFNGTWSGSNPAPTSFKLNGVTCTGSPTSTSVSPSTSRSTTTTSRTTTTTTTTNPGGGGDGSGPWPTDTGSVHTPTTRNAGTFFDGGMKRYYGIGDGGQGESQDPMFVVANGGTIQNVIIDAPAGDGIHCEGSCTIRNVWWNDVGEDAATFKSSSASATYLVDGGGAKSGADKVFQHNGAGTVTIRNFQVHSSGKLYRACGNCSTSYQRHVVMDGVTARSTKVLAGINTNWGDTARFSRITVYGSTVICEKYQGVPKGSEPKKIGEGADGRNCFYSPSDITQR
ncbi:pectate lyase [Saccharothrix luteola]|uniref:pectate lyase n=1 Tax=Saccharothrix luteola TaxID=2893018 RepID=UPI001E6467D6|nr:pectate lyase [Saccharothrix luteola]MCC8250699.1 pectate lyase [Saccharothrix luteola]